MSFYLPAAAQTPATGSGISLTPPLYETTISPGHSTSFTITMKNVTNGDITAVPQVNDFTADGTSGAPKIIGPPNPQLPTSIKPFVATLDNVAIPVNQQKKISVSISVPQKQPAGAYYGVIRWKAVPAGANAPNPGQVALTASVGTVVLITVPGNIRSQVQFNAIHVYHGTKDGTFFFTKPEKIGIEIRNLGNGFEKPFGTVEVHDMFNKLVTSYQINHISPPGNVLPNSTRIFTNPMTSIKKPGRYTVQASISYGDGSNILTLKKNIWYIPTWLLIAILIILAAIIFLIWRAWRHYQGSKRHHYRDR